MFLRKPPKAIRIIIKTIMKTYKHLFEKLLDVDLIRECIKDASRNKRTKHRKDVQYVKNHMEEECYKVFDILVSETYQPIKKDAVTIVENSCRKERDIVKPRFRYDQIIQHVVMSQLEPIIMKSMYPFCCASVQNRGDRIVQKYLKKWIRKFNGKKFYVLKMDIKKFFPSIDQSLLKRKLQLKIRDEKFLDILFKIIDNGTDTGIPIGFYTSQWLANWYLQDLDYFIKQDLGAKYYVRYMDDMVILGRNKRELHRMRKRVAEFLQSELHLKLKENWQVFRFVYPDETAKNKQGERGRFIDFVGFKFYYNRTTLRKTTLGRIKKRANRLSKKDGITWYDACQMNSGYARMRRAQTHNYYTQHIKATAPTKKKCCRVISQHQKKVNENDGMEKGSRNPNGKTGGN